MDILIFKVIALLALYIFAFFISDFRDKKGMIPLVNKRLILFIKIFYFIPILIYTYVLINLHSLLAQNYLGLFLICTGVTLVAKAKKDIGKYHTWTGHKLRSTKIVTNGIYAFIRHPLYTGIYIFIIGAIMTSSNNNPFSFYSTLLIIAVVISIMIFLAIAAFKESKSLQEEFGKEFLKYKKQVHPFLPLRKYSFEEL